MSQENLQLLRYGFYALTVVLGLLLLARIIRSRNRSVGETGGAAPIEGAQTDAQSVDTFGKDAAQTLNPVIGSIPNFSALSKRDSTSESSADALNGSSPVSARPGGEAGARRSMAAVLAGIRLPLNWEPGSPDEIKNPVRLTSTSDTPAEMATQVADELARLGFTVTGTGTRSAKAERDVDRLDIMIIQDGPSVTTQIALSRASSG